MRFARDGFFTIAASALLTAFAALFSFALGAAMGVLTLFVLWFFRDPDRSTPDRENAFFSPADGRVVEVLEVEHPFTGPAVRVGIFMNVFSVHVNRAPCAGRVAFLDYVPGKKVAAFAAKASEVNERNFVGLSTARGPVMMVQIAGLLARRIVCRLKLGDALEAGQRYGMIRLGSRVDIYLPREVRLTVKIGDKVYAGVSRIGEVER